MKKIICLLAFGVLLSFTTSDVFASPSHGGGSHAPISGHVQMAGGHTNPQPMGGHIGNPQPIGHIAPHAIIPPRTGHIAPPSFIRPIYTGYYGYTSYYYNPYYSYYESTFPVAYTPISSPVLVTDPYATINTTANVINTAANVATAIKYISH